MVALAQQFVETLAVGIRRDVFVRYALVAGAATVVLAIVLATLALPRATFAGQQVPAHTANANRGVATIDMSTSTVAQIIATRQDTTRFNLMLYNSGASAALAGSGPYTVFVPADNYFDYLPRGYIAGLSQAAAYSLAVHHVAARALTLSESLNGNVLTAAGDTVSYLVNAKADMVQIGGAKVFKIVKGSNGTVYIIDRVLIQGPQQ